MNIETILQLVGLHEKEAGIYKALVEYGPYSISDVARYTRFHRPSIYKEIPRLIERGLASSKKIGQRIVYEAASPDVLFGEAEQLKEKIFTTIDEFTSTYTVAGNRPRLMYAEGRAGVKKTLGDIVKTMKKGDTYYRYGSRRTATQIERYKPAGYEEERDRKALQRYVITSEERAATYSKDLNRLTKTVPKNVLFDDDIQIVVYGDKISIVDFELEYGIILEHKKLANFQKKLFKLLFARL